MELVDGNRLHLLRTGAEFFPSLEAAIAAARHEIYLETYIFADDEIGRRIARALAEAAAQGVRTSVIVDGMTVKRYIGALRGRLLASDVSFAIYRPGHLAVGLQRAAAAAAAPQDRGDRRSRRFRRRHQHHRRPCTRRGTCRRATTTRCGSRVRSSPRSAPRRTGCGGWSRSRTSSNGRRRPAAAGGRDAAARVPARRVPDPRQLPPPLRYRGCLPRRDRGRERGDHPRQRVFLSRDAVPPRAGRGRRARGARGAAAAGTSRVRDAALRVARAVRRAARRGCPDLRVHEELPAREGRGHRRPLGDRGLLQHRSVQPAARAGGKRRRRRTASSRRSCARACSSSSSAGAQPVARARWRRQPRHLRVRIWIAYGVARFFIGWFGYGGKH